MARSIPDLITAVFAREPLTSADARRLARYLKRGERTNEILTRTVSAQGRPRTETTSDAAAFVEYRRSLLQNLRTYTITELRGLVRQQLVMLSTFVELFSSQQPGFKQRQGRDRAHKAAQATRAKREGLDELHHQLADIQTRKPHLSKSDAARQWLKHFDPAWGALGSEQQQRRVRNVLQRQRREEKRAGTR